MALASPFTYSGYKPPRTTGSSSLARTLMYSAPVPAVSPTAPTGPRSAPQIPYDEFGTTPNGNYASNTSQPLFPGNPGPSAPTSSSSTSSNNTNNNSGGGPPVNFDDDPILARIRAYNQQQVANAESAALAARKQAEIGYGYDPNVQYEDAATQEAAKQNAFSTLAQLLFNHGERGRSLDESLNKSNLFYSGERARQLGLEGRQYTLENSQANSAFQNQLGQIAQMVLQAKNAAQERELQAEEDAYNRALQFALQYGTSGGSSGGSNGGLENPNQFNVPGDVTSAANNYASNHPGYQPHMVMQEGTVTYDENGNPGVYIKYSTPAGDSTEWTPI